MKGSAVLLLAAMMCMSLAGCGEKHMTSARAVKNNDIDMAEIASAKNIEDLLPYIDTYNIGAGYSECEKGEELLPYSVLLGENEYFVKELDGEKYLIFNFGYFSYSERVINIDHVRETESSTGDELALEVGYVLMADVDNGCFPGKMKMPCIVRAERDFEKLIVNDEEYFPYSGGVVSVGGYSGALDGKMELILPVKYQYIGVPEKLEDGESAETSLLTGVYDGGCDILDRDYNIVLETKYNDILYSADERYVVNCTIEKAEDCKNEIYILDKNGDILKGPVEGKIPLTGSKVFGNEEKQEVFVRSSDKADKFDEGIIDSELNIVIEPKYESLIRFSYADKGKFYVVKGHDGKCAVFDINGEQLTEFIYDSVAEAQTDHRRAEHKTADF